jgi:hypothetical protein
MCIGIGRASTKRRGREIATTSDVELQELPTMSNPNCVTPAGQRRRRRSRRREDRRTRPRQGPSSGSASRLEPGRGDGQSEASGEDNITPVLGSNEHVRSPEVLHQPIFPGSGYTYSNSMIPQSHYPSQPVQRLSANMAEQSNDNSWRPHDVTPGPSSEQSSYHQDPWYRPPTHVPLPRGQVRQPHRNPQALVGDGMTPNNRMNLTPGTADRVRPYGGGSEAGFPHHLHGGFHSLTPSDMVSQEVLH